LIAAVVPGVGWTCARDWLQPQGTVAEHLRRFGYDQITLEVDAFSSSSLNAHQIRDALLAIPSSAVPRVVLIGYSKGAPDALQAVVEYPEIRNRLAAVVSIAGAVGGSALGNPASQSELELLQHVPGADCGLGDRGAVESLKPATRHAWLAQNTLPQEIPFYSIVTFPDPAQISRILRPSYDRLSQVDGRNDSQLIFYDQVIPGSTLVGYLNADHWAVAVPIARSHGRVGRWIVDHNAYPREAMVEALLRYLEEDLTGARVKTPGS
jgi:pimeloyl-ACP methyl ester carboxylesterase